MCVRRRSPGSTASPVWLLQQDSPQGLSPGFPGPVSQVCWLTDLSTSFQQTLQKAACAQWLQTSYRLHLCLLPELGLLFASTATSCGSVSSACQVQMPSTACAQTVLLTSWQLHVRCALLVIITAHLCQAKMCLYMNDSSQCDTSALHMCQYSLTWWPALVIVEWLSSGHPQVGDSPAHPDRADTQARRHNGRGAHSPGCEGPQCRRAALPHAEAPGPARGAVCHPHDPFHTL